MGRHFKNYHEMDCENVFKAIKGFTQLTFTCLQSIIETSEKGEKYVQS